MSTCSINCPFPWRWAYFPPPRSSVKFPSSSSEPREVSHLWSNLLLLEVVFFSYAHFSVKFSILTEWLSYFLFYGIAVGWWVSWLVDWLVSSFIHSSIHSFIETGPHCSPGWFRTHYIGKVGFELTDLPAFLLNTRIKGEHHMPPRINILSLSA